MSLRSCDIRLTQDSVAGKTIREKSLQRVANTLCQMFCGWRLVESKPVLVELGSGTFEIDALTGKCKFQSIPTPQLPIARELLAWMKDELASRRIPIAAITRARLTAKLCLTQVPWNIRITEMFPVGNGAELRSGTSELSKKIHQCTFDCESEVVTDGLVYHSRLREVQEWSPIRQKPNENHPPS